MGWIEERKGEWNGEEDREREGRVGTETRDDLRPPPPSLPSFPSSTDLHPSIGIPPPFIITCLNPICDTSSHPNPSQGFHCPLQCPLPLSLSSSAVVITQVLLPPLLTFLQPNSCGPSGERGRRRKECMDSG